MPEYVLQAIGLVLTPLVVWFTLRKGIISRAECSNCQKLRDVKFEHGEKNFTEIKDTLKDHGEKLEVIPIMQQDLKYLVDSHRNGNGNGNG